MSKRMTDRWLEPVAAEALKQAKKALGRGKFDATTSPFGEGHAPWDWRYARVRGELLVRQELNKCDVRDIDFEGADFTNSAIERCRFENVRFDQADLSGTVHRGNVFVDCTFVGTWFLDAGFGYDGNHFERCKFERAKFRKASCVRGEFDECEFISCDLKGMDFNASSFARCRFAGKLEDVWFRGGYAYPSEQKSFGKARPNRMDHVSFRDAILVWPAFSHGCDLSTVAPPAGNDHKCYDRWQKRLDRIEEIRNMWNTDERKVAEAFLMTYRSPPDAPQNWYILNVNDLISQWGRQNADLLIRTLETALT
jgi:uncharacterized protein YjbI with pentapeptide repeats